jgi:hypothetical protein
MEGLKILCLSVAAAVTYGILQDQITARVCVEYFTIGHPPIFNTENPTLLAFGWGILATWWVGVGLGLPLVFAARYGSRPPLTAHELVRPLVLLMVVTGVFALLMGLAGYGAASSGMIELIGPLASRIPRERHTLFLADAGAHLAAYLGGFLGAVVLWVRTWRRRAQRESKTVSLERTVENPP